MQLVLPTTRDLVFSGGVVGDLADLLFVLIGVAAAIVVVRMTVHIIMWRRATFQDKVLEEERARDEELNETVAPPRASLQETVVAHNDPRGRGDYPAGGQTLSGLPPQGDAGAQRGGA